VEETGMFTQVSEHPITGWACLAALGCVVGLLGCGDSKCGKGTEERDGKCVPSGRVSCGEGTVLQGDRCLVLCAEPEKVHSPVDGACVFREPEVGEAAENNDPTTGGVAAHFDLPAVGSTIWLGGVVQAPGVVHFNETHAATDLAPDIDVFQFDAVAGQVIAIEAIDAGTSSAAFAVARADLFSDGKVPLSEALLFNDPAGPWVGARYPRWGISRWGERPVRTIRILETATYYLAVGDRANFLPGLQGAGCPGCGYLVSVTSVDPADVSLREGESVDFDIAAAGAAIRPDGLAPDQVYQLEFAAPARPNVRWVHALGGDDQPLVSVPDYVVRDGEADTFVPLGTEHYNAVRFTGAAKKLYLDAPALVSETETKFSGRLTRVPVTDLGAVDGSHPASVPTNSLAGPNDVKVFHLTAGTPGRYTILHVRAENQDDGAGNPFDVGFAVRDADYRATPMKYAQVNPFNPDENVFWQNVIRPGVHGAINDIALLLTDRTSIYFEVSADLPAEPPWPFAGPVTFDLVATVAAEVEVDPIYEMSGDEPYEVSGWLNASLPLGTLDGRLPLVLRGKLDRIFFDADFFAFTVTHPMTVTILQMPDVPYEDPRTLPGAQLYGPTQNFGILVHGRAEGDSHIKPGFTRIPGGFVTMELQPADYYLVAGDLFDQGMGTPPNPPGYVGGYTLVVTEGAYE
jgi:hypothetical protein